MSSHIVLAAKERSTCWDDSVELCLVEIDIGGVHAPQLPYP